MKLKLIFNRGVAFALSLAILATGIVALQPPQTVSAGAATRQACEALPDHRWRNNQCVSTSNGTSLSDIVTTVVSLLSIIVAIVAVIMIIWGGFKYVTSGGDSGKTASARNTILYAIVGLTIAALAQFLVQFVLVQVR